MTFCAFKTIQEELCTRFISEILAGSSVDKGWVISYELIKQLQSKGLHIEFLEESESPTHEPETRCTKVEGCTFRKESLF
jgi:hypothetical protein